jgi:hypothetical protein
MAARHLGVGAKHIADVLMHDASLTSQYAMVASGYGDKVSPSATKPYDPTHAETGDVCVWDGAEYGHVMMCVGHRANGTAIWRSDFTAREGNWTGLMDPASHGTFHVFRQRTLEGASPAPAAGPGADPAVHPAAVTTEPAAKTPVTGSHAGDKQKDPVPARPTVNNP